MYDLHYIQHKQKQISLALLNKKHVT